jgi:hypothetical protein
LKSIFTAQASIANLVFEINASPTTATTNWTAFSMSDVTLIDFYAPDPTDCSTGTNIVGTNTVCSCGPILYSATASGTNGIIT